MRDKVLFGLYLLGLGSVLCSRSLPFFLGYGMILMLLANKTCFSLLKKTLKSVLWFNLTVSIGYMISAQVAHHPWVNYLVIFNLRVFVLTFSTFLLASSINIAQALSFSKTLSFLWTICLSQIYSYQKSFENFMLSLKSRVIKKMNERAKKEFIASVFGYFFTKALYDSEEKSLALKARGLFDQN